MVSKYFTCYYFYGFFYVFYVFFKIQKRDFLRFFALLHTFSRIMITSSHVRFSSYLLHSDEWDERVESNPYSAAHLKLVSY